MTSGRHVANDPSSTWWPCERAAVLLHRHRDQRAPRQVMLRLLVAERRVHLELCLAAAVHEDEATLSMALPALLTCERRILRHDPMFAVAVLLPIWERFEREWVAHPAIHDWKTVPGWALCSCPT